MVEVARAVNGKFVSRIAQESTSDDGIIAGDVSGTPEKHSGLDQATIDPAEIDRKRADNGDRPAEKRKPGRPKGGGEPRGGKEEAKRTEAPGKLDLDSLNFTLFYAHALLAKATQCPEIALDETEAKTLAKSCTNVMQHYNIKASQKAIDWGNLLLTMGIIYGGKFHAISSRKTAEKKAAKEAKDATPSLFGLPH